LLSLIFLFFFVFLLFSWLLLKEPFWIIPLDMGEFLFLGLLFYLLGLPNFFILSKQNKTADIEDETEPQEETLDYYSLDEDYNDDFFDDDDFEEDHELSSLLLETDNLDRVVIFNKLV